MPPNQANDDGSSPNSSAGSAAHHRRPSPTRLTPSVPRHSSNPPGFRVDGLHPPAQVLRFQCGDGCRRTAAAIAASAITAAAAVTAAEDWQRHHQHPPPHELLPIGLCCCQRLSNLVHNHRAACLSYVGAIYTCRHCHVFLETHETTGPSGNACLGNQTVDNKLKKRSQQHPWPRLMLEVLCSLQQ